MLGPEDPQVIHICTRRELPHQTGVVFIQLVIPLLLQAGPLAAESPESEGLALLDLALIAVSRNFWRCIRHLDIKVVQKVVNQLLLMGDCTITKFQHLSVLRPSAGGLSCLVRTARRVSLEVPVPKSLDTPDKHMRWPNSVSSLLLFRYRGA